MIRSLQIEFIGTVRNSWKEAVPSQADEIMKDISEIVIDPVFEEGLFRIEKFEKLNVLFYFHKSSGFRLQTTTRSGDYRGVFATCSPMRPSLIGMTTVNLLSRDGNILKVSGLDAIDGTPVLDIKPVIV